MKQEHMFDNGYQWDDKQRLHGTALLFGQSGDNAYVDISIQEGPTGWEYTLKRLYPPTKRLRVVQRGLRDTAMKARAAAVVAAGAEANKAPR